MRTFQMSNFKNKNCSELLLTNGMGLDGAPVKFLTLVFLRPPNEVWKSRGKLSKHNDLALQCFSPGQYWLTY